MDIAVTGVDDTVYGMLSLLAFFVIGRLLTVAAERGKGRIRMLYVVIGRDAANSLDKRLAARPDHLQRLQRLRDEGRLLLAGPLPAIDAEDPGPAGFRGSLIVAEFDSLEDADAWAQADPYVAAGVYESVEVSPLKKVLP